MTSTPTLLHRAPRLARRACGALTLVVLTGCVSSSTSSSGKKGGGTGGSAAAADGGGGGGGARGMADAGASAGGASGTGGGSAATGGAAGRNDGGTPSGTLSCVDLVQCISACDASTCQDACGANASPVVVDAAVALGACAQSHACSDATCIQSSCQKELAACTLIRADGGTPPQLEVPLVGTRESWGGFSYVAPPGMTEQTFADGVVLTNAAKCTISLLPQVARSGEAGAQALSILLGFVGAQYPSLYDENGGTSPLTMKRRGQTGDGFPWMMVRGYLSDTKGAQTSWAQVMLVTLGSTVAPVVGVGDRSCFDDPVAGKKLDWTWTLLSLRFPGAAAPSGPRLGDQLLGKWLVNTGTILLGEIYAANGHYGTVSSLQTYSQVTSTDVLRTTTTFFGDGTFEALEDRLSTHPASGGGATRLFTIIEEENSAVSTGWLPVLHRIEQSVTDKQPYEFTIARDMQ